MFSSNKSCWGLIGLKGPAEVFEGFWPSLNFGHDLNTETMNSRNRYRGASKSKAPFDTLKTFKSKNYY